MNYIFQSQSKDNISVQRAFIQVFISLLISIFTLSAFANLSSSINNLIANQEKNERIGIYIQNLETGSVLYEYNGNEPLTPASTTKVFTAAAAYLSLGPEYRYTTTILTNAAIAQTLKGNVYIRFSGDPTLSNIDVDMLVRQLRLRGVRNIAGNVILDQSVFSGSYYGVGWTPDDYESCYGAPIAGAIINSNCSSGGVVKYPGLLQICSK